MTLAWKRALPFTLLVIGAAMIALGVARGEAAAVLRKAVMICLECIGLG